MFRLSFFKYGVVALVLVVSLKSLAQVEDPILPPESNNMPPFEEPLQQEDQDDQTLEDEDNPPLSEKPKKQRREIPLPHPGQLITIVSDQQNPESEEEIEEEPLQPDEQVFSNPVSGTYEMPSQTVYSNPFILENEENALPIDSPIEFPSQDEVSSILQNDNIATTVVSYDTATDFKKYSLSFSGYFTPFYQETQSRRWVFLNLSAEFGWILNSQLEIGPFTHLDLALSIDGSGAFLDNDSQITVGGFAEYQFYKLNSMRRFFPSLGMQLGYSGMGGLNRSGLLAHLYLDMVFFFSKDVGIKWNVGPLVILTRGRPDYTIQVDSKFGLVYYF